LVRSGSTFNNPQAFSTELWFKTTTLTGGNLVGFGNAPTGNSSTYDRHVYMTNAARLVFGVWTGSAQTIVSPLPNGSLWIMVGDRGRAAVRL